jgi:DNA-binding beta-propeller fold protein YncE
VQVAWEAIHDGPGSGQAKAIGVSPKNQTVFVTGSLAMESTEKGGLTIAYSMRTGETIWSVLRPHASFRALVVDPSGEFVIVSGSETVAFDTDSGDVVWSRPGGTTDIVISVDGESAYLVLEDKSIAAVNTRNGAEDWRSRMDLWGNPYFRRYSSSQPVWFPAGGGIKELTIGPLPGGAGVAAAGIAYYIFINPLPDIWPPPTTGYCSEFVADFNEPSGSQTWSPWRGWRRCTGSGDYRLASSEHGLFLSEGVGWGYGSLSAFVDGDCVWGNRHYGGYEDLAVGPEGSRVFSTGTNDDDECDTSAFSAATGSRLWSIRHDGSHDVWTRAVALSDDGKDVLVTGSEGVGWSWRTGLTLALSADDGGEIWRARFGGHDESWNEAIDIATSGDQIFVTGCSGSEESGRDFITVAYWRVLEIDLDIQPALDPNVVDPMLPGVVPVALLGSEDFDVTTIDPESLRFGPDQAEPCGFMPVRDLDPDAEYAYLLPDVNGDGYDDLIVQFDVQQSGIQCGDTEATLTGELQTGRPFEGADEVVTVGCD